MLGYHALCWPPAAQQGGGTGAGEEMGESGIRNLNACLFSIPCAVNLSK